jgi:hypothetical protein
MLRLSGRVADRAYFGDHWDYTVSLADQVTLTVSAEPSQAWQVGEEVVLEIDPEQMSVIADDEPDQNAFP